MTAPLDWELSEPAVPGDVTASRALTPEEEAIAEWLAGREDEPVEAWCPDGTSPEQ